MLLEGVPARRVTALVESPDYAERGDENFYYEDENAICFGMTPDGDVHAATGDSIPNDLGFIRHCDLAEYNFGEGAKSLNEYAWTGRAWVAKDAFVMSFWHRVPPAVATRIARSLRLNYGIASDLPTEYQTPRQSDEQWIPLGAKDTSPELSREEKKLRELEYQLHTATPDQKAFIRKGIAIARQKIEQERASDEKLLADLGESEVSVATPTVVPLEDIDPYYGQYFVSPCGEWVAVDTDSHAEFASTYFGCDLEQLLTRKWIRVITNGEHLWWEARGTPTARQLRVIKDAAIFAQLPASRDGWKRN